MRTTGTRNKRDAEAKRSEIMAPFAAGDEVTALQNIAARIQGRKSEIAQQEEESHPALTIDQTWQTYVVSPNRTDCGERTLSDYEGYFKRFRDWLAKTHPKIQALRDVTEDVTSLYAQNLSSAGLGAGSYNKHRDFLKTLFDNLRKEARMSGVNPWVDIKRKKAIQVSRRELTVDELRTVCGTAKGELCTLFAIGIYSGLRLGDCATLRWAEVDMTRGLILRIPNKAARRNQTPVRIPIHATLREILSTTPPSERQDYVLPEFAALYMHAPERLTLKIQAHFASCMVRTTKRGTGPDSAEKDSGGNPIAGTAKRAVVEVGFHSLRHTFVSLCRAANAPLSVVESIVGHSNPAMTRHYTHTSEAAAGAAVAALPDITGQATVAPLLPAAEEMISKAKVRELVETLTHANLKERRTQLLSLVAESTMQ